MEDKDLIQAAAHGDREAFRQLFDRFRDRVWRVAHQVTGSSEDSRDVAQKVFLRLWEKLPSYRSEYPFEVWLHRITVNAAIDAYRRRRARGEEVELDEEKGHAHLRGPRLPGAPEAETLRQEVQRIFDRLSERLPLRQRLAFTLREIEGLSTEEVAAILRTAPSTVRNQVFQARQTLQAALRNEYPEYLPKGARAGQEGQEGTNGR